MTTMYGIKNCDTIKKAKKWLENENISYQFHDYRTNGLTEEQLCHFEEKLGWEALLNKRGTTYRQLTDEQKNTLNKNNAITLLLAHPTMIKRPLLVHDDQYTLGFKVDQYQAIFQTK